MWKMLIKIAIVILLIKEAWLLLQIPSVAEAVLSFIMVGAVPGTNTTLTPDQMIQLLIGVFVISAALIFRKEIVRLFRKIAKRPQQTLLQPVEQANDDALSLALPQTEAVALVPVKTPSSKAGAVPEEMRKKRLAPAIALLRERVAASLQELRRMVQMQAARLIAAAKPVIALWMQRGRLYGERGLRIAGKVLLITYIIISVIIMQAWSWLRPRIERFDRWLDKKLHQNEHTAAILAVAGDIQKTLQKAWAGLRPAAAPPQKDQD